VGKAGWFPPPFGKLKDVHKTLPANDIQAPEPRVIENIVGVTDARGLGNELAGAAVVNAQSRRVAAGDKELC